MMVKRMPKRFLDDAPKGVYDIFDDPDYGDRYTVLMAPYEYRRMTVVPYLAMSADPFHPQGIGVLGEMEAFELRAYRDGNRRKRIAWDDLPDDVKRCVQQRLDNDS